MTFTEKTLSRFWDKVKVRKENECWIWVGAKHPDGHGQILVGNRMEFAHRVSFAISYGSPRDEFVCHRCNNPRCVNPKHLYTGTHNDNMNDMIQRGSVKGSKNPSAKLNEDVVREIKIKVKNKDYRSIMSLAQQYGVSKSVISDIITKRKWKHVKA